MDPAPCKSQENLDSDGELCLGIGPEGTQNKWSGTGLDSKKQLSVVNTKNFLSRDCSTYADSVKVGLHSAHYGPGWAQSAGFGDRRSKRYVIKDQR